MICIFGIRELLKRMNPETAVEYLEKMDGEELRENAKTLSYCRRKQTENFIR